MEVEFLGQEMEPAVGLWNRDAAAVPSESSVMSEMSPREMAQ
jgi:hypothetical protein